MRSDIFNLPVGTVIRLMSNDNHNNSQPVYYRLLKNGKHNLVLSDNQALFYLNKNAISSGIFIDNVLALVVGD